MALYLALKEVWRNRSRYLLFSLVIALITTLVLFIAALASGLATANKQFIEKIDADLLVYQENVDLQATSSRLGLSVLKQIRRVDGVQDVGPVGFSNATLVFGDGQEDLDISLVGVEPGKPGDPALIVGSGLRNKRGQEAIIDEFIAQERGLKAGDSLILKAIQGTEEEFFNLTIVGITDERQYFFQPAVIVPINTWDEIRPQPTSSNGGEVVANIFAVKLNSTANYETVSAGISQLVDGVETTDKGTAILAIPGYTAQQSTLNTQRGFTLFIAVLVVGGFFQIQTLQKVAQIGMLKAIGTSNANVATSALLQILAVTLIGVAIGAAGTMLLAIGLPAEIPIRFSLTTIIGSIFALFLIGPIGGLVSIRLALKIDPLNAIGLSS